MTLEPLHPRQQLIGIFISIHFLRESTLHTSTIGAAPSVPPPPRRQNLFATYTIGYATTNTTRLIMSWPNRHVSLSYPHGLPVTALYAVYRMLCLHGLFPLGLAGTHTDRHMMPDLEGKVLFSFFLSLSPFLLLSLLHTHKIPSRIRYHHVPDFHGHSGFGAQPWPDSKRAVARTSIL